MTDFTATAIGICAFVLGGVVFVFRIREIVLQHRAEEELVRRLVRQRAFQQALLDYLEARDQYGLAAGQEVFGDVERHISVQLGTLGREGRYVQDALHQPSTVGRQRYLQKLMDQATEQLQSAYET